MDIQFDGKIWYWRGPAPHYFVSVPDELSQDIKTISSFVTYGWGVIPVRVQIGSSEFTTSLFPKDGRYIVPIKLAVRKALDLDVDDVVTVRLEVYSGKKF